MMEEMSPVAVPLTLGNPSCENPAISNHMEITRLKLVTETASLLSNPVLVLDDNSSSNHETDDLVSSILEGNKENPDNILETVRVIEDNRLFLGVQESEEEEILLLGEDPSLISSVELLPLDPTSDLSVPLNDDDSGTTSMPIAVEIEGTENGEIVAKFISLDDDILSIASKPNEESSSRPIIKESVVTVKLSSENDCTKSGVKSVFELDCVPLWGSVSICGNRPEMEDAVAAASHFMKIPINMFISDHGISQTLSHLTSHFFGVYDGHGGSEVADYCRDRIHLALVEELNNVKDYVDHGTARDTRQLQWEKVFTSCFLKVDGEVGRKVVKEDNTIVPFLPDNAGSTAVVAVVCSSHIIVANCGDSRAVLFRGKEAIPLSIDHKPSREDEYARIEASGGRVIQWNGHRVFGVLAMSRSIGDAYLKPWIIPEPEVMFVARARSDECLVLASDGLWDVMSNEEVCEVARKRILIWHKKNGSTQLKNRGEGVDPAAQAAAEYLANMAIQKGSKDNISVIVVDLKAQRKFKSKS